MIAMGALRKREISQLRKGFEALTIDHQKGVMKTARGLLRVQRVCRTMATDNTWHVSLKESK
jgi:hypothetical protein